ncbi:MAG: Stp1/IreP family PP2C-type Ser/Thr phosphatase [Solirubrobacterales bacterium]
MVELLSDIGNFRKINEDYIDYYIDDTKRIYVVADGMGGHNAGDVASKLAVENTISYINSIDPINDIEEELKNAILNSNKKIFMLSRNNDELSGMGTTITACMIRDRDMVVANVGDSRCYIIKNDEIIKVTKDHSLVQQLIDEGSITEDEGYSHPNKNIITRALGTRDFVDIDTYKMSIDGIIKVIMCTDGLSNLIKEEEIYDIVMNKENCCMELIELSKARGGKDNISVIVFEGECKDDRNCSR